MEYSPKCHPIYTRASLSGRNIIVVIFISIEFAVVLSSIEYLWKKDKPKVSNFGPTLNPLWLSLLKMVKIEKNKWQCGKTSAIELSKYVQKKSLLHLPFPGKIRLFFAIFRVTLPGNTLGSQVKGVESKFDKYTFDKYKYTYTFDKYKYKYTFTQIQIHIHLWQIHIYTNENTHTHLTNTHLANINTNTHLINTNLHPHGSWATSCKKNRLKYFPVFFRRLDITKDISEKL